MLITLNEVWKALWKDHIVALVQAYNCIRNESAEFALLFYMLCRNSRFSFDVFLGLPSPGEHGQVVHSINESLEMAYQADATQQAQ